MKAVITEEMIRIEMQFSGTDAKNALLVTREMARTDDSFTVSLSKVWGQDETLEVFFQKQTGSDVIEAVAYIDDTKLACWDVLVIMESASCKWMYDRINWLKDLKANLAVASQLE